MAAMPVLPTSLPSLTVREAILDAVYRLVNAFDTANPDLFESAMTKDAVFDLNGQIMDGLDAIRTQCFDPVSKLDTTHFITNARVNIPDGESAKASVTATALAQHFPAQKGLEAGAPNLLAGSLYFIDLVKDETDGLWKAKYWRLKSTWAQGDWGVFGK
ncbi:hypothetical protein ASPZODRAFT_128220 [Penicilliopsis zonata CBS 506.65]|uniref:SnoaL-like domain-containing protein n=1 Tax=Penicilliopsis zonata CBS 506.65 TaxID=1073090 RepID=A0A1L9SR65_9EURO|nr:hypothetical protein ASPZODRAFT_128220 [Penicilliopsis zonata CBS 506.65]OJJ49710.1 hypothetical protein ASPZODRAFT_128220 [Penicilliopsis zonata CBS 506.65]